MKSKQNLLLYLTTSLFFLILVGCSNQADFPPADPQPKLHLSAQPDFASIKNTQEKKQAFFDYLSPIVAAYNQNILQARQAALALENAQPTTQETQWLEKLAAYYRIDDTPADGATFWQAIRQRVDVIPPSLALAQAANESAWGTSRFARDGHNFFGEWCYQKGCGIVPNQRAAGANHEVRAFPSALESVGNYIHNLNTHLAYYELRQIRAKLRQANQPITGLELVKGLTRYSERGQAYVDDIAAMIRYNQLTHYDSALNTTD